LLRLIVVMWVFLPLVLLPLLRLPLLARGQQDAEAAEHRVRQVSHGKVARHGPEL
jgi:hypothetical protein